MCAKQPPVCTKQRLSRSKQTSAFSFSAVCNLRLPIPGRLGKPSTKPQRPPDDYAGHLAIIDNSNATINRKLAAVSRMLSLAVERGKLQTRPTIQRKREGEGRIRFLNEREELQALHLLDQWGKRPSRGPLVLVDTGSVAGNCGDWKGGTVTQCKVFCASGSRRTVGPDLCL